MRASRARSTSSIAYADDEFKLGQVRDVLTAKMAKRGVDVRLLDFGTPEKISGDKLKQPIKVRNGIDAALARKIVALLKDSKLKVSASIQGDTVRVSRSEKGQPAGGDRTVARRDHHRTVDVREFSRLTGRPPVDIDRCSPARAVRRAPNTTRTIAG